MGTTSVWKDAPHAYPPPIETRGLFAFVIVFFTLALWLVIEVDISVLRQFQKRRGLYFWSLLVSSWGVFCHTLGYILNWFVPQCPWQLGVFLILFGWSMMVTGQALVLYSRLHLVILDYRILRAVLILIIMVCVSMEIIQWTSYWAASVHKPSVTKYWTPINGIIIRITQIAFLLEEALLSGLYVWGALQMLTPIAEIKLKKVLRELIVVVALLVIMDIAILCTAYTNQHIAKEPVQSFSYALKLKLEFFILNQLVEVVSRGQRASHNRYTKDSGLERSGGVFLFGAPATKDGTKDSSTKTGMSLPIMTPTPNAKRANSDGSSESAVSNEVNAIMNATRNGYTNQQMDPTPRHPNNVAWVTREVSVTHSPMRSADTNDKFPRTLPASAKTR